MNARMTRTGGGGTRGEQRRFGRAIKCQVGRLSCTLKVIDENEVRPRWEGSGWGNGRGRRFACNVALLAGQRHSHVVTARTSPHVTQRVMWSNGALTRDRWERHILRLATSRSFRASAVPSVPLDDSYWHTDGVFGWRCDGIFEAEINRRRRRRVATYFERGERQSMKAVSQAQLEK